MYDDDSLLRHAVLALKQPAGRALAVPLAMRLADLMRDLSRAGDFDLIVPAPAHPRIAALRGFNQAALLAQALGNALRAPVRRLLRKVKQAELQASLPATRRVEAVKGTVTPRFLARRAVAGRRVLLVDDVMTTGATIKECARVLLAAGAKATMAAILARTP
ncbi:MAG: ComF family protein [Planctomycetes bacterium]|nr:ComF family protein [Planctomycetota bacterium]